MTVTALTTLHRSFSRHKLFALLNVGGLALGIAACLVLLLFVRFETGFDRELSGSDKLWLLEERYTLPGIPPDPSPLTMGGELDRLRGDFPDLEGTRFQPLAVVIRQGSEALGEDVALVDPNFFSLMPYPVSAGDPVRTLADPDGMVVTEGVGRKYFGERSPIGRTLTVVHEGKPHDYRIGAVVHDLPANTNFKSELFVPLLRSRFGGEYFDHWGSSSVNTLLRFPDDAAAKAFEARIPAFLERHAGSDEDFGRPVSKIFTQSLRPLSAVHLYTPAQRATVTTLGAVGLLTLLIAMINYVNLATARASLRAREVALRKVLGGTRRSLVLQFMGEAVATVAVAALIGLALAEVALPFVNTAGGTTLTVTYVGQGGVLVPMIAMVLVVGALAGIYPALVLSRFQPAAVLASARAPGGGRTGARLRSVLVVGQFAVAVAFAIGTAVMVAQIAHIRAADLGFGRDGLIIVRSFSDSSLDDSQKAQLLSTYAEAPGVVAVTQAQNAPGDQNSTNFSSINRPETPERSPSLMWVTTGPDYFETYGARLVAGRLFSADRPADDRAVLEATRTDDSGMNVIINEAAVRSLGFRGGSDAVGKVVKADDKLLTVVGVVGDVRFLDPHDPVPGTVYFLNSASVSDSFGAVRYSGTDSRTMMESLEQRWRGIAPGVPFKARTADDNLDERYYKEEGQRARLFTLGAALAIIIGCIGLYGLATFDTSRRVKEIGIRKTLGASSGDVLRLLVGQFLRPVLVANVIAWPLAYLVLRSWLAGYDDRVALSPVYFVVATVVAVAVATATVAGQARRVSRSEPARALRHE